MGTMNIVAQSRLTVTVTECANLLGISRDLCYAQIRLGAIPSIRLGRRLVVPRLALEHMIATVGTTK